MTFPFDAFSPFHAQVQVEIETRSLAHDSYTLSAAETFFRSFLPSKIKASLVGNYENERLVERSC